MEEEYVLELEEGEISEESEHNYIPLERPSNYSELQNPCRLPLQKDDSESEEELTSESGSDSDSNLCRTKKPRIKIKPKLQKTTKLKKYDVWSNRAQEDVLTETLNSCDVTTKDRSRAVESYDYTLGAKYYDNCDGNTVERRNNKRSASDRYNKYIRHNRRRSSSSEGKSKKGKPREILPLVAPTDVTNEQLAKDIANKLFEQKEELIFKVVDVFGRDRAMEVFEETRKIEADGGMMIMNQSRRRTPGGVFLYLVRTHYHITPEQRDKIFGEDRNREKAKHKRRQKAKLQKFKKELAAAKSELLPELLTRAEILTSQSNRSRDETDIKDMINPPPTPETDCHENSNDGMESLNPVQVCEQIEKMEVRQRKLESYDDDFLDIGCSDNMDLF